MSLMKSIKDFFFEYDTQTIDTSKITEEVNKEVGKGLGKKIDVSSTLELNKKSEPVEVEEPQKEQTVVDAKRLREAEEYNNIREINREELEEYKEEAEEEEVQVKPQRRREEEFEERTSHEPTNQVNNNFNDFFEEDEYEAPKKTYRDEKPKYQEKRTYESRDTRESYSGYNSEPKEKKFTPSLNISPVFGILDERKEPIKKIEVTRTIVSTSPKNKPNIDDVRNKAYGNENTTSIPKVEERREFREEKREPKEQKVYNVNAETPTVKGVTLGDADEYYKDLGLAYNEDYKDSTKSSKKDGTLFDVIQSMYDKE